MGFTPQNEADRRRRRAKGLIAGLAGIALLLGGQTFALWSASTSGSLSDVTAGDLNLVAESNSVKVTNNGVTSDVADVANTLFVPGDTVTFESDLKVTLKGKNMKADLTAEFGTNSVTFTNWVVSYLVTESSNEVAKGDWTSVSGSQTLAKNLTPANADADRTYHVKVTASLPSTLVDRDGHDEIAKLGSISFKLQQV
jgi:alternate signal-mediated exported protein